ncbi:SGS domain-containing protein [Umbelopsis sp. AD052]|nr:SGS domain-containing protein [Umbelopsis sp. AD052]
MSASDLFTQANEAFFEDDYDEALSLYTQAIKLEPENPEFYLKRCIAYEKVKKNDKALGDANKAMEILETHQGSRTQLAKGHLRRGISLYHSKKYQEAKKDLMASKELNSTEKTLVTWMRRVDDELAKLSQQSPVVEEPKPTVAQPSPAATVGTPVQERARHDWFQNDDFIILEIFIKGVKKDAIDVGFHERSLSVTIKMPNGSDYSLELDPLTHEIDPSQSKLVPLSTKVEIKLKKKVAGVKWGMLEGEEVVSQTIAAPWTSTKRRDWSSLEKEFTDEPDKAEGDQALNALFQSIYGNADEDAKRAMMKSFVESNGTCLSTNWNEVSQGQVETKPPEGMIAKKYS